MRMDRYEEHDKTNEEKSTRLNKNQELYTDVYLNNVYVDINNLKDVMVEDEDRQIEVKKVKDLKFSDYSYEDKEYDIVKLVNTAISNKDEEGIKGSFDFKSNEENIKNVLNSINEKAAEEKLEKQQEDLMADLMPSNTNTDVLPAVSENTSGEVELEPLPDTTTILKLKTPITNTSLLELPEVKTEEVCLDMLNEVLENENDKVYMESDDSFQEEGNHKYLKLIIILIIILIIVATAIILKLLHVF